MNSELTAASSGFEIYPYPARQKSPMFLPAGILILAMGAYAATISILDGKWSSAVAVGWFTLALGTAAIEIPLMNRPLQAPFRYLNSVVLTRSERAPIDSWVHVAPTRPVNGILNFSFALAALGLSLVAIAAVLQLVNVMPKLNDDTSNGALLLASVLSVVFAAVACWLSYLNLARAWRNGRFGARPSGVTFGEHTITIRVPGRSGELRWEHITSIQAQDTGGKNSIALIRLHLAPAAGVPGNTQLLSAHGFTVPVHALWTALRWYHAHPEARQELGRIEGERRLEGWRQTAIGMR